MRILILGGTGAIGTNLVNLMHKTEYDVYVTSRNSHQSYDNINFLQCDAKEEKSIEKLLKQQWDTIIDFMIYHSLDEFERIKLLFLQSTKQYIFMSSARVYADSELPIKENSDRLLDVCNDIEYLKKEEYALLKAKQEDALINSSFKNWTIVRPYITYNTYRLQLGTYEIDNWLFRAINKRGIVFDSKMLNKKTTLTSGIDVAKRIYAIIGSEKSLGEIFNIASNQYTTWKEIMDIYFDAIEEKNGYRPKLLAVSNIIETLDIQNAQYQILYDRMFNRTFDSSKIEAIYDGEEYINIEKSLRKCIMDFLEEPKFGNINWKFEAVKDKITGDIASYEEIGNQSDYEIYLKYRYSL